LTPKAYKLAHITC